MEKTFEWQKVYLFFEKGNLNNFIQSGERVMQII